ncbi:MAG: SPFH domain-containing protein [bacterium]|nr:SPFH domain-containing protein [bacterium]
MAIWRKLRGEFVDIVEWTDDSQDTLVYRFQRYANEIKYGAQLVVREGQDAVFVNQGKLADVFEPGRYILETDNLPILSTLQGWKHGFSSPFKAEVYFVSTRRFTDLKWGTKNPLMLRDQDFGLVRLRAFGTYAIRVHDAAILLRELVGTDGRYTTDEITDQLRNVIVSRFADLLGESNIPALDLVSNYDELGSYMTGKVKPEFNAYGLDLTKLLVENISLPEDVEAALDKRTSMAAVGNLNAFSQFQAATAMEDAANNPGTAGGAVGLGMGMIMGGQMGQAATQSPEAPAPPPVPPPLQFFVAADGQQTGPFGMDTLAVDVQQGRISRDTLVWQAGMAQWTRAGDVDAFATLFGATPPPLPPQVPS